MPPNSHVAQFGQKKPRFAAIRRYHAANTIPFNSAFRRPEQQFNGPRRAWLQALQGSAITPPFVARLTRAAVAAIPAQSRAPVARLFGLAHTSRPRRLLVRPCADEESKMPKLKTKSGAKKRFKITAQGKVKYQQSGKRHGMIKRTTKTIREHRGTAVMFKTDGDNIKKYFLPNG
jgi:large subunit ribosomal protein L35